MTKNEAIKFLLTSPYKLGHMVGFDKLTELNNRWIVDMVTAKEDRTLQAHRISYKTTCVSIALAIIVILFPKSKTLFLRKTESDVKEVILQTIKILKDKHFSYLINCIYGCDLQFTKLTNTEFTTNLAIDVRGTDQLVGRGIGGSLTGKHFEFIFTDDIVNLDDRKSKAVRDETRLIYQELHNVVTENGRIYNTGTPWHKNDCFDLMPKPEKWDCYSTGLMSDDDISKLKESMTASLFSANYELRHIAAEDIIFSDPQTGADSAMAEQGMCHIDAAYGGSDYTAFTICRKYSGKYYVLGKCWQKHVDDVQDEIIKLRKRYNAGVIYCENNGDKGYLAKALRAKGERVSTYHEKMNKFIKITSYLKSEWQNVVFVDGTDKDYIDMICDYNENADHDDCPDSLASIIRKLYNNGNNDEYVPVFGMGWIG